MGGRRESTSPTVTKVSLVAGQVYYNTQEKGIEGTGTALANTSLFLRIVGQCQAAVAEAVSCFGRIDILFLLCLRR